MKILVSTYETQELPTQIVALAWGYQMNVQEFNEALLLKWYRRFVNQQPK